MKAILAALAVVAVAGCEGSAPPAPSPHTAAGRPGAAASSAPSQVRPPEVGERFVRTALAPPVQPSSAPPSPPASAAPPPGVEAEAPPVISRIRVPGDIPATLVARAEAGPPRVVFLPGICSVALPYLQSFPEAARDHGGMLALDGDVPCPNVPGYRQFSWDAGRQHARIEAALAAAGASEVPAEGITVIGYSQGAVIAEQLVQRWPDRYTRAVLIGAPNDLAPAHFAAARGLVTMSCSLDVTARMREGARRVASLRVPATYMEMPGCRHGGVAEAERVFGEALGWLEEHAKPTRSGAASVPLVGVL